MCADPALPILAVLVLLGASAEALAGFGSIVIALTLGSHFVPIRELVPVLVTLNVGLTVYMVARHRGHVEWRLLATRLLPVMGVGLAIGLLIADFVTGDTLKRVFGGFVAVISVRELRRLVAGNKNGAGPSHPAEFPAWTFLSGIIHGIYAASGPVLVYGVSRLGLPKRSFRSSLATVWLFVNGTLATVFFWTGRTGPTEIERIVWLVPVLALGITLGEWAHNRIDEERFRIAIFALLLPAGASLLF